MSEGIVEKSASRFCDHEGMSIAHVQCWCDQFGSAHKGLSEKLLEKVIYIPGTEFRELINSLISKVTKKYEVRSNEILYVPIETVPGSGSSFIMRVIRDIKGVSSSNIKTLADIEGLREEAACKLLLLLDDFSGSGKTLDDWWKTVESMILPWIEKGVIVVIGIIVINQEAYGLIRDKIPKVYLDFARRLSPQYNVLNPSSIIFTAREKRHIEAFCRKTRCGKDLLKGFGNCGLLFAFKHGCPNNSLPILWYDKRGWRRLFKRRAI